MKKRMILTIGLVGLVLTACTARTSGPSNIQLNTDDGLIQGAPGGYCWDNGPGGTLCVDPFEPEFGSPVALPAEEPIRLQLDKPLPDTVTLWLSEEVYGDTIVSEDVQVAETLEWSPQVEEGEYILNVDAAWRQGETTYRFSILLE